MNQMFEKEMWSSGNSQEHSNELHKSLTTALKMHKQLFPLVDSEKVVVKDSFSRKTETCRNIKPRIPVIFNLRCLNKATLQRLLQRPKPIQAAILLSVNCVIGHEP